MTTDPIEELLHTSHAKHQLVNILMNEQPGFETWICQMPFKYLAQNSLNPSYGETTYVFEIAGRVYSATDDASWGWHGPEGLADNMMDCMGFNKGDW